MINIGSSAINEIYIGSTKVKEAYIGNQQVYSSGPIDLSLQDVYGNKILRSTANCYVVKEAGDYKFPLVYGNAIKNGKVNTAAFTNNGGSYSHDFVDDSSMSISDPYGLVDYVEKAVVLNSDTDDVIENLSVIDGYIQFQIKNVPTAGANVIIGGDEGSGSILWSWHIWLWPHDLSPVEITNSTGVKYNIMPVNLASKYDSDGVHIKNWFYQWGRMTPLLCPASYNSTSNHSPGVITTASKANTIVDGIANPTTFYYNSSSPYNWFGSKSYYNLWDAACMFTGNSDSDTVKTVYDPCPVGWKVPNGNTFTGLSVISESNGIVKMARYSGDTTGVEFPLSGFRNHSDGSLYYVGSSGYVRLSSAYSQDYAYYLYFDSSYVYPQDSRNRARGFSVRPVEDDNIQLDVIMISFTIAGTTYQAESGMTWFEWVNSEYNTGGFYTDGEHICASTGVRVIYRDGTLYYAYMYNNVVGGRVYDLGETGEPD